MLLPPSAGAELMRQDAPKNGAQLFELRTASGHATHAGVLDFTAAEGSIAVPPHVLRNLAQGVNPAEGFFSPGALPTPTAAAAAKPGVSLPWAAGGGVEADPDRAGGAAEAGASGRVTVTYRRLPKGAGRGPWAGTNCMGAVAVAATITLWSSYLHVRQIIIFFTRGMCWHRMGAPSAFGWSVYVVCCGHKSA